MSNSVPSVSSSILQTSSISSILYGGGRTQEPPAWQPNRRQSNHRNQGAQPSIYPHETDLHGPTSPQDSEINHQSTDDYPFYHNPLGGSHDEEGVEHV